MGFTMVNSSMEGGLGTGIVFIHSPVAVPSVYSLLPAEGSIAGQRPGLSLSHGSRQLRSNLGHAYCARKSDVTAVPRATQGSPARAAPEPRQPIPRAPRCGLSR